MVSWPAWLTSTSSERFAPTRVGKSASVSTASQPRSVHPLPRKSSGSTTSSSPSRHSASCGAENFSCSFGGCLGPFGHDAAEERTVEARQQRRSERLDFLLRLEARKSIGFQRLRQALDRGRDLSEALRGDERVGVVEVFVRFARRFGHPKDAAQDLLDRG